MSRKEFMEQLEQLLMDIPSEERIEALAFYNNYFEDAGEENEERVIRELGSPQKVAKSIKADLEGNAAGSSTGQNLDQENTETVEGTVVTDKKNDRTSKIVLTVLLVVLTIPVWVPATGAIAGGIVGILGAILGIVVAFAAVTAALYIAGFVSAGIGIGLFVTGNPAAGIALTGIGLVLLALAILCTIGCVWLFGRCFPWMIRGIVGLCSRLFHRKERVA